MLRVIILSVIMMSVTVLSVNMLSVTMLSVIMLSVIMLSVIVLSAFMVSVIMLSVIMLSVIMLSVIMLSIAIPLKYTWFVQSGQGLRKNSSSPGVEFTTLHFLCNLQMGSISSSVCPWQANLALGYATL